MAETLIVVVEIYFDIRYIYSSKYIHHVSFPTSMINELKTTYYNQIVRLYRCNKKELLDSRGIYCCVYTLDFQRTLGLP